MIGIEELELKTNTVYILFCDPAMINLQQLAESVVPPENSNVMLIPCIDGKRPDTLEGVKSIKNWIKAIESQGKLK